MFDKEFYPTPEPVIIAMMEGETIQGQTILEPSAGKGNIVDYLLLNGAEVIASESNEDLCKILQTKCRLIGTDFLKVESHTISHVSKIVMNPPFSNADEHILHAYNIAPQGCKIIALCNTSTLENTHTARRKELKSIIDAYGDSRDLENCFIVSERQTGVNVSLIKIQKPGESYQTEFDGFCMDEEPTDAGGYGIMKYDFIRDLVQRYIQAVKLFDEQLNIGVKMNNLTAGFYSSNMAFEITEENKPISRNEFKKDLQKSAWNFIFNKMNLTKYATRGLRDDINKFVEQQQNIPFTMKNIYIMLDIVIGTTEQRMDKALLEVFDKLTLHHAENRHFVKGWKTNSHYLVGEKFIMPNVVCSDYSSGIRTSYHGWAEPIEDLVKAMCYISAINYEETTPLNDFLRSMKCRWAQSYCWGFFDIKCYKNGNVHFKFQSQDLWATFNQRIAKLKGYPLFEAKAQTKYQEKQTGRDKPKPAGFKEPVILQTFRRTS